MCSSHQPIEGADSGVSPALASALPYWERPGPIQCGQWVERDGREGFCALAPDHEGRCNPPEYEVTG